MNSRTLVTGMILGCFSWTIAYFFSDLQQFEHKLRFHLSGAAGVFTMFLYLLMRQYEEIQFNKKLFDISDAQLVTISALVDEQRDKIEDLEKKIEELTNEVSDIKENI